MASQRSPARSRTGRMLEVAVVAVVVLLGALVVPVVHVVAVVVHVGVVVQVIVPVVVVGGGVEVPGVGRTL